MGSEPLGGLFGLTVREFLDFVHATRVEDITRMFAGHPQQLQDALDDLEESLTAEVEPQVVALHSADREAAWAAMAGG